MISDSERGPVCDDIQLISEWPVTQSAHKIQSENKNDKRISSKSHSLESEVETDLKRKGKSAENYSENKKPRQDDSFNVDFAETVLAKWWRHTGRYLFSDMKIPKSTNPKTLIYWVARTEAGKMFLSSEKNKLKALIKQGQITPGLHASLASVEEILGELNEATQNIQISITLDPHNRQYQWKLEKIRRQMKIKLEQEKMMSFLPQQLHLPTPSQIVRVSSKDLSVKDFYTKFEKTRTPVVITDLVEKMTKCPWTLEHIQKIAGDCSVTLKKPVTDSVEWARLEDAKSMKVKDFINHLISPDSDLDLYLFDWSLPQYCLPLAQELTIPKYFAGDFLQKLQPGSQYRDSWPSLFIAAAGVNGKLHVDTFGSNFWMALFQGKKKWTLYPAEELSFLYPQLLQSMDPTFEVDLTNPDLEKFPLLSLTHPVECILQPGDLLFVPAACPHQVSNLETSVAISANFVDTSNFDRVKEELWINALVDPCAADLVNQMRSSEFKVMQNFNIGDLKWNDFKKWPPD